MGAVEWSGQISLGAALVGLSTFVGLVLLSYRVSSTAAWRDRYLAEKERSSQLEVKVTEEREKKHAALSDANALRLVKDVTPVLEGQHELLTRLVTMEEEGESRYDHAMRGVREMFADHEDRAQQRHEAQIVALQSIASRLDGQRLDRPAG